MSKFIKYNIFEIKRLDKLYEIFKINYINVYINY